MLRLSLDFGDILNIKEAFMSDILIRPYRASDYDQVIQLMVDAFYNKIASLGNFTKAEIILLFDALDVIPNDNFEGIYVAHDEKKILGVVTLKWKDQQAHEIKWGEALKKLYKSFGVFKSSKALVGLSLLEHTLEKDECYIDNIAVSSEARGKGIGTLLLKKAHEISTDLAFHHGNVRRLTLHVVESNDRAKKLYEKFGFTTCRTDTSLLMKHLINEETAYFMEMSV